LLSIYLSLFLSLSLSHLFSYFGLATAHAIIAALLLYHIFRVRSAGAGGHYQFSRTASEMGCIHVSSWRV